MTPVTRTSLFKMSNSNHNGPKTARDLMAALECPPGTEYDEEVFLYFLDIERARAERTNRPLRLLAASVEPIAGKPVAIAPATAASLFEGLKLSLRETDLTGWYRQQYVAGAVLTERAGRAGSDMSDAVQKRVEERLRQRLPSKVACSLHVRVIPLRPGQAVNE